MTKTLTRGQVKIKPTILIEAVFLLIAVGILFFNGQSKAVQTLALTFVSIVLEAIPFMAIGAMVGGIIEACVSREKMASILPKRKWQSVFIAAGLGIIFPVCECAVVPVVRRLARKGLPGSAAVAYLLGGPIVNPIVAASTSLAYKGDFVVTAYRLFYGYLIAVAVGLVMGWIFDRKALFIDDIDNEHEHQHGNCGCGQAHSHEHHEHNKPTGLRFILGKCQSAIRHGAHDFLGVGHFLIMGAFIAALAQTFISRELFFKVADIPVVSSGLMMVLAVALNLCSEADAFIAASFRSLLTLPAQMAFMLMGPTFDIKLLLMYQSLFKKKATWALVVLIVGAVLGVVIGLEIAWELGRMQ